MTIQEALLLLFYPETQLEQVPAATKEEAAVVAQELDYLPIALQQARSYTRQTKCSFGAYRERLLESREKLLAHPLLYRHDSRNISTYASFSASFAKVEVRDQKLLQLLSCFHPKEFPLDLLNDAAKYDFSDYETQYIDHEDEFYSGQALLKEIFFVDGKWNVTNLDDILLSIQQYSLVSLYRSIGTRLLQMHRLLHEWVHSCIPDQDLATYESAAIILIALGSREHYTFSARYLESHVTKLSPLWGELKPNEAEAFASILQAAGLFKQAVQLRERVIMDLTGRDDLHDTSIVCSKAVLASTYRDLGQFAEAQELQQEVLRSMREIQGERHPDTITAYGDLVVTYRELGQFKEAEMLQKEVLKLRREVDGERHPETIKASYNLALIFRDLGHFKEAEVLLQEVLRLRKDISGVSHPDTIGASASLAVVYRDLNRLGEAETLQVEVLERRKETLGERHPLTIDASGNLAVTYRDLRRFDEARLLQEDVLKLRKETLGERHPDTLAAANNMADFYHKLGRLTEAVIIQENVVLLSKESLGEEHLSTAIAMLTLAEIYESLRRRPDALDVIKSAIFIVSETLGEDHPLYSVCQELESRVRPSILRRLIARLRLLACRP